MRRKKFFILDKDSIKMTKIREDWGFKSAFFDMFPNGDSVLVWGKGFGHGIGMSQEGAMKMARASSIPGSQSMMIFLLSALIKMT